MAKKLIDVMDTTFRDGFQSIFGGRVQMEDFLPAVEAAKAAGISHFEFGGGARFQTPCFHLNENPFEIMDKFRNIVGQEANLQTLSRGVNTVFLEAASSEIIDLHAKLFKKHGATTIRNFDALNDVDNLLYPSKAIKKYGLNHEIVITMMDLPPNCYGAHDVAYYEKVLKDIINSDIEYDSLCFKDATGTSSPHKIYETISLAKKLLPEEIHVRLHTHESAGVSVSCYLAALEAGVDGIDLAASPVSGGTSQPDFLTLLQATKGTNFDLAGLDKLKILEYEDVLRDCLKDYPILPEATKVLPMIQFSPMPGGALTANIQMMRENNVLDKFYDVIRAMQEVVRKGGYATSVTPVSQFYFQQAYNNVLYGSWKKFSEGYAKMILGYYGKTPVEPDSEIVELAKKELKLEPATKSALEVADSDKSKSIEHYKKVLEDNSLDISDENIFLLAACDVKGIEFLKGNGEVHVRKYSNMKKVEESTVLTNVKGSSDMAGQYTVVVNGVKYNVDVVEGHDKDVAVTNIIPVSAPAEVVQPQAVPTEQVSQSTPSKGSIKVLSQTPGNVWKIVAKVGDKLNEGDPIMILEAMKMEIDIPAPSAGVLKSLEVNVNDVVADGQLLATME